MLLQGTELVRGQELNGRKPQDKVRGWIKVSLAAHKLLKVLSQFTYIKIAASNWLYQNVLFQRKTYIQVNITIYPRNIFSLCYARSCSRH